MLTKIKALFGIGPKTDYAKLMKQGALIIDVRSMTEYDTGHISGSINIPLNQLANNLSKLKGSDKPVITCCASGMRSSSAKAFLAAAGYTEVYDGGGWRSLQTKTGLQP